MSLLSFSRFSLDIANKQAQSVVTPNAANKSCKSATAGEQTFTLVTGPAAHAAAAAAAANKAK